MHVSSTARRYARCLARVAIDKRIQKFVGAQLDGLGEYFRAAPQAKKHARASVPAVPFRALASGGDSGTLSRFNENRLEVLFWKRAGPGSDIVFGAIVSPSDLREMWQELLLEDETVSSAKNDYCVALLDENARPVAINIPGFAHDWNRPFVASRIGESLPSTTLAWTICARASRRWTEGKRPEWMESVRTTMRSSWRAISRRSCRNCVSNPIGRSPSAG